MSESESEKRLRRLREAGAEIEQKTNSEVYIFVVGSVMKRTAKESSDTDYHVFIFKPNLRSTDGIDAQALSELRDAKVDVPSTPVITVALTPAMLATSVRKLLNKDKNSTVAMFWKLFKGEPAYATDTEDQDQRDLKATTLRDTFQNSLKEFLGDNDAAGFMQMIDGAEARSLRVTKAKHG